MSEALKSKQADDISVGDPLPEFSLNVTPAVIVAGAIASRDFMPAHHDPAYAKGQGAPDVFMNILTTNGYVSRFVTDWAGPESMIRKIATWGPGNSGSTLAIQRTGREQERRV